MSCNSRINTDRYKSPSLPIPITVPYTDKNVKWSCKGNISVRVDNYPLNDGITYYSPPYTTEIKKNGEIIQIDADLVTIGLPPNTVEHYFTFKDLEYGNYEIKITDKIGQEIFFCHEIKIENGFENPCEKPENYKILSITDSSNPLSTIRNEDGTSIINILETFKGYMTFNIKRFIPISNIDPGMCLPLNYNCCKSFYIELDPKSSIIFDPSKFSNPILCNISNLITGNFDYNTIIYINSKKILIEDNCQKIKDYIDINNKGSIIKLPIKSDISFGNGLISNEPNIDTNYFEHTIIGEEAIDNLTLASNFSYSLYCASCKDEIGKLKSCDC